MVQLGSGASGKAEGRHTERRVAFAILQVLLEVERDLGDGAMSLQDPEQRPQGGAETRCRVISLSDSEPIPAARTPLKGLRKVVASDVVEQLQVRAFEVGLLRRPRGLPPSG